MSRVVFVTGGNRGIGLACAKTFSERGYQVAITYREGSEIQITEPNVLPVLCDITSTEQIESAFKVIEEELGPVEILIGNAGITRDGLSPKMSDQDFSDVIETNLVGSFRVARRAVRSMIRARWGRIIFISSIAGRTGQAGQVNYAASKAGLLGLARSLAKEFGSRNITVNVVAPGPISTDMLATLTEEQQESYASAVPLGRLGDASEVAEVVYFLGSNASSYMTGAVLPVDGGLYMG